MAGTNVIPKGASQDCLRTLLGLVDRHPTQMALFKNDYTPDLNTTLANLTEADFPGYARGTTLSWSSPVINLNNRAESETDPQDFERTSTGATQTIYGLYLLSATNELIAVSRFDNPIPLTNQGDFIQSTAIITFGDRALT